MSEIINSCMKVEFSRREAIYTPTNNRPSIFGGGAGWWEVGVGGGGVKSSEGRSRMVREGQGSRSTVGSITLYQSLAGISKSPYLTQQDYSSDQHSATRTLTIVRHFGADLATTRQRGLCSCCQGSQIKPPLVFFDFQLPRDLFYFGDQKHAGPT